MWAKPQTRVSPYSCLNSWSRLPSTIRRITSRTSYGVRVSAGTTSYSVAGSSAGSSTGSRGAIDGAGRRSRVSTIERTIASACASSSARWSTTPEVRACTSPPPRSSAVTTSPVAAFTSGGPPRKIVPWFLDDDGLVGHRRHVGAAGGAGAHHRGDLRDAAGRQVGLVEEDPAEVLAVGEDLVLHRQERAAGVDEVDAGQVVLGRDRLGAQVLLDRDRVVGAALDGGVVGDDHALAAADPADAGDDAGRDGVPSRPCRTCRSRPAGSAPGTGCPGRAAGRPGRGPAACRGRCACCGPPRCRRAVPTAMPLAEVVDERPQVRADPVLTRPG